MMKYKKKTNCENTDSVTSHNLYPSPVTNCHTFSEPLPLEHDILYERPHRMEQAMKTVSKREIKACLDEGVSQSVRQTQISVFIILLINFPI